MAGAAKQVTATNGNGNGRRWAEIAAFVASIAALWIPMQQSLVDTRSDLRDALESFKAGVQITSEHAQDERDRLEKRLKEHSDTNASRLGMELTNHLETANQQRITIEEAINDLRERTRANEAKLVGVNTQIEIQHRMIREALRSVQVEAELVRGAYWDDATKRIVWPVIGRNILEGIGEAQVNGNGHK